MESRSKSRRPRKFIARALVIAGLLIVLAFGPGCGARPDSVARQFYERLAALDIGGMSQVVCEDERSTFRQGVEFLESAPEARALSLEDFKAKTERSDGTSATMTVSGRFVEDELGEMGLSGRVRLVREGSDWCISGERDGFRSVWGTAGDVFALLIRGGISRGAGFEYPEDPWPMPVEVVTPAPSLPTVEGEVVTTETGLRYVEIEQGSGRMPQSGDEVTVHYTLWLEESGERIDTTRREGTPLAFVLGAGQLIAGFDEGVSTMRVGGIRRLIVGPELGYGEAGQGNIPPGSTLVFDVELVEAR